VIRRLLAVTVLLGAPAVAVVGAAPGGAQSRGACVVTVNGTPTTRADSPGRAFEFGKGDVIEVVGTSTAPVRAYDITLHYGFIGFPAKSGTPTGDDTRWSGEVQVDDYTPFGVGLYRVEGTSSGAAPCSGWAYVRITGAFPLATVAGAVAAVLAGVGIAGALTALRPTGRAGRGHRIRGPLFGAVGGIGIAVLLQQFAVLAMSALLMIAAPVVGALVGLALGWPRPRAAAPSSPAAAAPSSPAPDPAPAAASSPPEPAPAGDDGAA
jgi:hypothetical protein